MILKNYAQKGRIFYHWRIMHMNLSYLVNNLVEKRHSGFLYTNHQKWKEKKKKKNTYIDYDNSSHHSCIQPLL